MGLANVIKPLSGSGVINLLTTTGNGSMKQGLLKLTGNSYHAGIAANGPAVKAATEAMKHAVRTRNIAIGVATFAVTAFAGYYLYNRMKGDDDKK
ncbi:hypothetical protein [Thalassotalea aquiviva]|uniref:hypothetical protein n=1 Tax=Thalassotalea aquiviva TaxID=3242415 RepID=UPI00352BBB65